jgi:hypothetical protein
MNHCSYFHETRVHRTNVLKNFCTEHHEKPKHGLVADNRMLTEDGRMDIVST